jgi:hypothetical protein
MAENEDPLIKLIRWQKSHLFGKYRGTVESVAEGDDLGIISVRVPAIWGKERVIKKVWPCSPFAGSKHGFVAIPEPGDGVWVEFEGGITSRPIWTGFWWGDGAMPEPKGKLVRTFITSKGHKLVLDDDEDSNKVMLLHKDGAELTMTDQDITIKIGDASAKLTSSDITLSAGTVSHVKIEAGQITISAGTVGTVKLTSGGVDIANGALKLGV